MSRTSFRSGPAGSALPRPSVTANPIGVGIVACVVDPASILVITLGALFIERRQILPLAVTLLVGVTIHQSCMFLVPFAYAYWAEKPLDGEALRDLVRAAALPVIAYVYLRSQIIAAGAGYALRSRRTLALVCVAALACMDVGYAAYMQIHGVRYGLDSSAPPARGPVH